MHVDNKVLICFINQSYACRMFLFNTEILLLLEHVYLQLTINSISEETFLCITLLAVKVKFFVSVHLAFAMTKLVVFTVISDFNKFGPSYQDTFDKGLLSITLVRITLLLSLTTVSIFSSMKGLSASKILLNI